MLAVSGQSNESAEELMDDYIGHGPSSKGCFPRFHFNEQVSNETYYHQKNVNFIIENDKIYKLRILSPREFLREFLFELMSLPNLLENFLIEGTTISTSLNILNELRTIKDEINLTISEVISLEVRLIKEDLSLVDAFILLGEHRERQKPNTNDSCNAKDSCALNFKSGGKTLCNLQDKVPFYTSLYNLLYLISRERFFLAEAAALEFSEKFGSNKKLISRLIYDKRNFSQNFEDFLGDDYDLQTEKLALQVLVSSRIKNKDERLGGFMSLLR